MKKLVSESTAREIMKAHNFKMAKKFGQNFLIDENVLNKIVESAELKKEDNVIEIGPGMGTMTQLLCKQAGKVVAIEIDRNLIPILNVTLFGYENVKIINEDVLKVDLNKLVKEEFEDRSVKVVANLPYYITTPIIMGLLEQRLKLKSVVVMVQKEVAERIAAAPGGKDYGALSVAVQYYSKPEIIMAVPPAAFIPEPEVDSAVIKLEMRDKPAVEVKDEDLFFKVVKAAFGQRRKTLLNALQSGNLGLTKEQIKELLLNCNIDERRRGETLSLEEFAALSDGIYEVISYRR